MTDFGWVVLAFLLRTLLRPFALELARAWYHLALRIVSMGVGEQARSLWEDEVLGDLELEIWQGLKDPKLSRQEIALRVLRRSLDLLWNGWAQRADYVADAERAGAGPARPGHHLGRSRRTIAGVTISLTLTGAVAALVGGAAAGALIALIAPNLLVAGGVVLATGMGTLLVMGVVGPVGYAVARDLLERRWRH